jgi:hypothetical protein
VITLSADDAFVIGIALDDWLEQNEPDADDSDACARYEHTVLIREALAHS